MKVRNIFQKTLWEILKIIKTSLGQNLSSLEHVTLKVSKNRNDFMKTSFLPKSNAIILKISALKLTGQKSLR